MNHPLRKRNKINKNKEIISIYLPISNECRQTLSTAAAFPSHSTHAPHDNTTQYPHPPQGGPFSTVHVPSPPWHYDQDSSELPHTRSQTQPQGRARGREGRRGPWRGDGVSPLLHGSPRRWRRRGCCPVVNKQRFILRKGQETK